MIKQLSIFLIISVASAQPSIVEQLSQLTDSELECVAEAEMLDDEGALNLAASKYCCKTRSGKVVEISACHGCNDCEKRNACLKCCASKCRMESDRESCQQSCG